jgi:CutA1 divalent ion tolerance protein
MTAPRWSDALWRGKVLSGSSAGTGGKTQFEQAEERLVLMRTRAELVSAVIDAVVMHHPYELPEVITLPIAGGAPGYLAWIRSVTSLGGLTQLDGSWSDAANRTYSHSMVPGGFDVMSSTTRVTPSTSLVMRVEIRCRRS